MDCIKKFNIFREEVAEYPLRDKSVTGPQDIFMICKEDLKMDRLDREVVGAFFLSAKGEVIGYHQIAEGGESGAPVEPAIIFRAALLCGSSRMILVHNHPSGDPEPSMEDLRVTERIAEGGKILSIELLDHIVIGSSGFVSIRAMNPGCFKKGGKR